ncbi:zf-CCHC domain-containing protein [Tanacetum coccineum]
MKRSRSKGVGMTRTERVKENALDAEIQITLLENVRSYQETKTKGLLLEDLRAIAVKKKKKKRPKIKRVLWLRHLMRNGKSKIKCFRCGDPNHLIIECPKPPRNKNQRAFVGGS